MDAQIKSSPNILVQCRICHDEDQESNMETPCSCSGTLKYAHRNCVQRWCSEKGNTTCEICLQQFRPGYTASPPPPQFNYGDSPINLGWNWEISRREIQNHQFIALFTTNDDFLEPDFEYLADFLEPDFEYLAPSPSSLICCRIVAVIFIVLLVLRHTLPIIFVLGGVLSGVGEYSLIVFMIVVLRVIEMLVPIYIMVKAIIAIQRLQYQDYHSDMQSHEENDLGQSQLRVIHIQ